MCGSIDALPAWLAPALCLELRILASQASTWMQKCAAVLQDLKASGGQLYSGHHHLLWPAPGL